MGNVEVREIYLKMNYEVQSLDGIVKDILTMNINSQIIIETRIYEKIFGIMNMGPKDSYRYERVNDGAKENTKIQVNYLCEGYSKITLYECEQFDYNCSKVGMDQIIIIHTEN